MRLVTASEKCFALSDSAGALGHLNKLARKRSTHKTVRSMEEELSSSSCLFAGNGDPCEANLLWEELEVQRKRFAERHVECARVTGKPHWRGGAAWPSKCLGMTVVP